VSFPELIFYPSKALVTLVLPPIGLVLLAILALLLLKRWPRTAKATLWGSCLALLAMSLPIVSNGLTALVASDPLDEQQVRTAQAIIVLGGGLRRDTAEYEDTVSAATLERARYGAALAKRYGLPILVTGGQVYGGRPEAAVMGEVLQTEFGTPVKWIEDRSRHTGENLKFSETLLQKDELTRVLLVSHDYHMRRSLAHCARTHLHCIAAPVSSYSERKDSWIQWLPNVGSLQSSAMAIHELCGLVAIDWR